MTDRPILFEIADGVATITLNRPDKLNALNGPMHEQLAHALDRILLDRAIRAVLLTGAGRAFCAGHDLSERGFGDALSSVDVGETLERLYNPLVRRLHELDRPIVCAVNGVAAGAGACLALGCDFVLAARSASFVQAYVHIGLIPDAGGTWFLPRLVGHARATAMAMLGEPVDANTAESWGLIWRCVEDEDLMPEATSLARRLAQQATQALGLTKRALRGGWERTLVEQLEVERDLQREAGRSDDFQEGVAAFLEKRPPHFRGR